MEEKYNLRGIIIPVAGFSLERVRSLENLPNEVWKDFSFNNLDYGISSYGRVKSKERIITDILCNGSIRKRKYSPKIMKGVIDKYGYIKICICHHLFSVHRLVCLYFLGDSNLEVNHKNGIKTDNRLENLEYCTRSENQRHAYMMGLNRSLLNNRKISKTQEIEIYNLYAKKGYLQKEIAKIYSINRGSVSRIYNKIKKQIERGEDIYNERN